MKVVCINNINHHREKWVKEAKICSELLEKELGIELMFNSEDRVILQFLWIDESEQVLGAGGFQYDPDHQVWCHNWMYFYPHARHAGHLTATFPYLYKLFGKYHLSRPLSESAIGFMKKCTPWDLENNF